MSKCAKLKLNWIKLNCMDWKNWKKLLAINVIVDECSILHYKSWYFHGLMVFLCFVWVRKRSSCFYHCFHQLCISCSICTSSLSSLKKQNILGFSLTPNHSTSQRTLQSKLLCLVCLHVIIWLFKIVKDQRRPFQWQQIIITALIGVYKKLMDFLSNPLHLHETGWMGRKEVVWQEEVTHSSTRKSGPLKAKWRNEVVHSTVHTHRMSPDVLLVTLWVLGEKMKDSC